MQRYGGGFQNWKEFPRKKMGRLLTHALPQPTPQYQPFEPLPATPPLHTQPPESPPQKSPQLLKFQHISALTPDRPKPRILKLPKTPK